MTTRDLGEHAGSTEDARRKHALSTAVAPLFGPRCGENSARLGDLLAVVISGRAFEKLSAQILKAEAVLPARCDQGPGDPSPPGPATGRANGRTAPAHGQPRR